MAVLGTRTGAGSTCSWNTIGKSYGQIFLEFGALDPASVQGSGDVKYHVGSAGRTPPRPATRS